MTKNNEKLYKTANSIRDIVTGYDIGVNTYSFLSQIMVSAEIGNMVNGEYIPTIESEVISQIVKTFSQIAEPESKYSEKADGSCEFTEVFHCNGLRIVVRAFIR